MYWRGRIQRPLMFRLIYRSTSKTDMSAAEISEILTQARRRNEVDGITGLLLYHHGTFFQVLEGDRAKVLSCFARVSRDPRHTDVQKVSAKQAQTRAFTNWFMGYEKLDDLSAPDSGATLSIAEIEERLDTVGNMEDVVESKRRLVRQLAAYLQEAA